MAFTLYHCVSARRRIRDGVWPSGAPLHTTRFVSTRVRAGTSGSTLITQPKVLRAPSTHCLRLHTARIG